MGGEATAKNRQAALRDRRRGEGMKYLHVWATPAQEQAIKAFLATTDESAFPVVRSQVDTLQDYASLRDQAEQEYRKYQAWAKEAESRLDAIARRELEIEAREQQLAALGARVAQQAGSARMSDQARAQALIERFSTREVWRTRELKAIDDPDTIKDRVQQITKLTAKVKSAGTVLAGISTDFQALLGAEETGDLDDAVRLLHRIGSAADTAKKRIQTLEKRVKEEDARLTKIAAAEANKRLSGVPEIDQIFLLCALSPYSQSFDLERLLQHDPDDRLRGRLMRVLEEVKGALVEKLKPYLKAGKSPAEATALVDATVAEAMPKVIEKHGEDARRAIAAVVAERLSQAGK